MVSSITSDKPFVSVVVPVYNEEYVLADCLAALQHQDYDGPYEIIVVDNACTDRSPEIALQAGARVVREPHKGYVYSLRAGCRAAQGEIIACTDADTIVPPDWLSRIVRTLRQHPEAVAISGVFDLHDCSRWLKIAGWVVSRLNWHLAGGNMAFWRKDYEAVGGCNVRVNFGADVELGRRLSRRGRLIVDRRLVASTSGRRFQHALWKTLWMYFLNDLWLLVFKKPKFYDFDDIRVQPAQSRPRRGWVGIGLALVTLLVSFLIFATIDPVAQIFGPVLTHVRADQPVIALTFDDGPSPYTAQVLDILARYEVKATFFVIGQKVEQHPDLARRIVAEGHVLGNHTYSHPLWKMMGTSQQVERELDRGAEAIQAATGLQPTLFRPPHGWRSPWMITLAQRKGYQVVTWDISSGDWMAQSTTQAIINRVVQKARPGAIILLHDGLNLQDNVSRQHTVEALPAIIEALQARGYRLVTIPELMQVAPMPAVPSESRAHHRVWFWLGRSANLEPSLAR
jgi:peptidoglycan/xylan/chitin deacetylase (PgdA/CDA1 family)/GT2 family glycosyltransferase